MCNRKNCACQKVSRQHLEDQRRGNYDYEISEYLHGNVYDCYGEYVRTPKLPSSKYRTPKEYASMCLEAVKESPWLIQNVPKEISTLEMSWIAVNHDVDLFKYTVQRDEKLIDYAITNYPDALAYISNPTQAMIKKAVTLRPGGISHVKTSPYDFYEEMAWLSYSIHNRWAIPQMACVPEDMVLDWIFMGEYLNDLTGFVCTQRIADAALMNYVCPSVIPDRFQTLGFCRKALFNNFTNLRWIKNHSKEICEIAVILNAEAIIYIRGLTKAKALHLYRINNDVVYHLTAEYISPEMLIDLSKSTHVYKELSKADRKMKKAAFEINPIQGIYLEDNELVYKSILARRRRFACIPLNIRYKGMSKKVKLAMECSRKLAGRTIWDWWVEVSSNPRTKAGKRIVMKRLLKDWPFKIEEESKIEEE